MLLLAVSPARAEETLGVERFEESLSERGGSPATQAGSHPYSYTTTIIFTHHPATQAEKNGGLGGDGIPDGEVKNLEVVLPAGLTVDVLGTERCSEADLALEICTEASEVGDVTLFTGLEAINGETVPVYNIAPSSTSIPGELGFDAGFGVIVHLIGGIRTGGNYALTAGVSDVTQLSALDGASLTLFGRTHQRPFLTLPTACGGPLTGSLSADSWQEPQTYITAESVPMPGIGGCDGLSFTPTVELAPESTSADTPTGLQVALKIPQPHSLEGLAEANLKEAVVTLPAGIAVNPSAANGLGACSEAEIGLNNAEKPSCPDSSKIATVKIVTPLLEAPLEGSVYVAQQGNLPGNGSNPFDSLFALYLVAEGSGVLVKLPGEVALDQSTGELTARFGEDPDTHQFLPPLPFSELEMSFFGGPGAPLVTPSACGTYTTTSELSPWSAPFSGPPATPQSSFSISSGCDGGFAPSFSAGTTSNLAGSFSPLTVSFSRQDGEQELHAVQVHLPPGLLGEIANVPKCGEAQANVGTCPQASEIGTVSVAAGAGARPFWITDGHAYITGPYAGQPFGLSIVVPAVAGPFNLGSEGKPIVVRAAISVNPVTAAVTITSEPFPTILQGVPLQVRTVAVNVSRPQFVLNPTSCNPMSISGTLQGTQGASAGLSAPYQAAGCANLPFKPSFSVSTQGTASKANGASLTVAVAQKPGEANIHKVDVQLPLQLPSRLTTLQKACTEQQFAANPAGCPAGSFVGYAIAHTPVLASPLSGPAILVSHGGAAFPDLDVILQGEGVTIDLTGNTDIKKGTTYSRFEMVPDAPISTFELKLPEGPHSVLAAYLPTKANYSFCGQTLMMPTTIVGQNGAQVTQGTKIAVTGCGKSDPTRAQELATALKACKKKPKRERASCESQARERYGTKAKKASGRRKG